MLSPWTTAVLSILLMIPPLLSIGYGYGKQAATDQATETRSRLEAAKQNYVEGDASLLELEQELESELEVEQ